MCDLFIMNMMTIYTLEPVIPENRRFTRDPETMTGTGFFEVPHQVRDDKDC